MNLDNICGLIKKSFPVGSIIQNPGGGTTTIVGYNDKKLSYIRKNSRMYLPYQTILSVFEKFNGKRVTTKDLKKFFPKVFDSQARPAGHSCNCTTLFMVLGGIGLAGKIEGSGKKGYPFQILIYPESPDKSPNTKVTTPSVLCKKVK